MNSVPPAVRVARRWFGESADPGMRSEAIVNVNGVPPDSPVPMPLHFVELKDERVMDRVDPPELKLNMPPVAVPGIAVEPPTPSTQLPFSDFFVHLASAATTDKARMEAAIINFFMSAANYCRCNVNIRAPPPADIVTMR